MTLADAIQDAKQRGVSVVSGSDGRRWFRGYLLPGGRMRYEVFDTRSHIDRWVEWPFKPPKFGQPYGFQIDWVSGDVTPPVAELRGMG